MEGSGGTECSKTCTESEENNEDESKPENGGSSSNSTVEENDHKKPSSVRPYVRSKMPRLRWTPDLHLRFVHAIEKLGGQERATPKLVLQMMNINGLGIAHVKSHLQMYRSKKIDDQGQMMGDHGHLVVNGDQNIYKLSQLPMLQGYSNQIHASSFRDGDASWITAREYLMPNPYMSRSLIDGTRPRLHGTVAEKIFGSNNFNWPTHKNFHMTTTCKCNPYYGANSIWKMPKLKEEIQTSSKIEECKSTTMKRKAMDCNIDLDLSLRLKPSSNDEEEFRPPLQGMEENINEVDSELSLSLYSPSSSSSKHRRLLKEGGGGEDHSNNKEHAIRRASTLDLTI